MYSADKDHANRLFHKLLKATTIIVGFQTLFHSRIPQEGRLPFLTRTYLASASRIVGSPDAPHLPKPIHGIKFALSQLENSYKDTIPVPSFCFSSFFPPLQLDRLLYFSHFIRAAILYYAKLHYQ